MAGLSDYLNLIVHLDDDEGEDESRPPAAALTKPQNNDNGFILLFGLHPHGRYPASPFTRLEELARRIEHEDCSAINYKVNCRNNRKNNKIPSPRL